MPISRLVPLIRNGYRATWHLWGPLYVKDAHESHSIKIQYGLSVEISNLLDLIIDFISR